MQGHAGQRVVMLLGNDLFYDSRVQREAQALAQAGYQVTVVGRRYRERPLPHEEWLGPVRVVRADYLSPTWQRLRWAPLRKLYTLAMLLRYGNGQPAFVRLALDQPADVVHAHNREMLPLGIRLARRYGARLIYDDHEFYLPFDNRLYRRSWRAELVRALRLRFEQWLEGRTIHAADGIITVNQSLAEALAARYRVPMPSVVMNVPLVTSPTPTPLLRERAGLGPQARVILYQGTIEPWRGLPQLLQSMVLLPASYHLVFVGHGRLQPELEALTSALGLGERVHFLPPVPPAELLNWTAAADMGVVLFETTDPPRFYASPNKFFEFMMAGLPVVALDIPEIRRVLERAEVGRLVPSLEPQVLAQACRAVLESPDYERYRREGRAVALERYNWQVEARKLVGLYEQVLADRATSSSGQRAGEGRA